MRMQDLCTGGCGFSTKRAGYQPKMGDYQRKVSNYGRLDRSGEYGFFDCEDVLPQLTVLVDLAVDFTSAVDYGGVIPTS